MSWLPPFGPARSAFAAQQFYGNTIRYHDNSLLVGQQGFLETIITTIVTANIFTTIMIRITSTIPDISITMIISTYVVVTILTVTVTSAGVPQADPAFQEDPSPISTTLPKARLSFQRFRV